MLLVGCLPVSKSSGRPGNKSASTRTSTAAPDCAKPNSKNISPKSKPKLKLLLQRVFSNAKPSYNNVSPTSKPMIRAEKEPI